MTREELYIRLDERLRDGAREAEVDAAIWREVGEEYAVFVSDLSGFTRITHQKGILHFLSIFRRAVTFAHPVLDRHGADFRKTEADNIMAIFPSVNSAMQVGL